MSKTVNLLKNVGIADLTFGNSEKFLELLKLLGLHIEYVKVDDHKVEIVLFSSDGRMIDVCRNGKCYISDKMTRQRVHEVCGDFVLSFVSLIQDMVTSNTQQTDEEKKEG